MYIYRKSDFNLLAGIQDITQFQQVFDDCIKPNYGGTESDYATIETDLHKFHIENINGVVVAVEDGLTIEEQRQTILTELARLDVIVPRVLEDIISQGDFTIHQSKLDIIAQKEALREQLQELEG